MAKKSEQQKKDNLQSRPPVVVILGHVDSGKTSILDFIRKTKVVEKESGGITQHIGAYQIEHQGQKITFIDTPGHEAFSAMRYRGSKVADIAILVVDAEEGVKPQTKEAISHIKKAGIPIIVVINKIDKPGADSEKAKRGLSQEGVTVESMGGKIPSIQTSAKTGQGMDQLLELIILVAEMEELRGDITKPGEGVVIESYLDNQRGPTATLLLRDGVLKQGDLVGTASTFGKIKILENFQGTPLKQAFASTPCIVIGFEDVPRIGEKFQIHPDIQSAEEFIKKKERKTGGGTVFFVEQGEKILNLILKADVLGSLEAIERVFKDLSHEKVKLRILKSETGDVQESDIKTAKAGLAKILAFRVKVNPRVASFAERENIKIMNFDVIYELAQKVRQIMEKAMVARIVRVDLGKVKVLVIFRTEKARQIIGGRVFEGEVKKGALLEVFRKEEFLGKGKLITLQKNKKDSERVIKGEECGILYQGDVKIEEGDILVFYQEERKKEEL